MTHTPRPWKRVGSHDIFADHEIIGMVNPLNENRENHDANARLIAAAPCLLTALDNILNCVDGVHDPDWLDRCKVDALAAIAQAKGEDVDK